MENPWKVIAAFIGIFVAGAIFGGFFSIGIGEQWISRQAAAAVPMPAPATPTTQPVAAPNTPATAAAPRPAPPQQKPLLPLPQTWQAPQLLRRYAERLDLTPEQKQRINPLIQRAAEDYRRVQQNTFRETAIILQRLHQDLISELTPDQRQKLEKWEQNQREIIQKMEQRQREARKEREAAQHPGQKGSPTTPGGATPPASANSTSGAATSSGATTASTSSTTSTGSEKRE